MWSADPIDFSYWPVAQAADTVPQPLQPESPVNGVVNWKDAGERGPGFIVNALTSHKSPSLSVPWLVRRETEGSEQMLLRAVLAPRCALLFPAAVGVRPECAPSSQKGFSGWGRRLSLAETEGQGPEQGWMAWPPPEPHAGAGRWGGYSGCWKDWAAWFPDMWVQVRGKNEGG